MVDIAVVDYGMGNLRSVAKAIEHVAPKARVVITDDPKVVQSASRVVFPGQGAMPDCMRQLSEQNLEEAVRAAAAHKPFLGICVGQQMLFEHSQEGDVPGLSIFPGQVVRFADNLKSADGARLKVPHMGWNQVQFLRDHPVLKGIQNGTRFYFVHSYYVQPAQQKLAICQTHHGAEFTSAVAHDNIFATQFHPEKSAAAGLALLENFVNWQP